MENNYSHNGPAEEVQALIEQKIAYTRKLTKHIESIRQAALGIDYQTRVQLSQIERKVLEKLAETHEEIKDLVRIHNNAARSGYVQGTLFE